MGSQAALNPSLGVRRFPEPVLQVGEGAAGSLG